MRKMHTEKYTELVNLLQALIIAFTSHFIPKVVYYFEEKWNDPNLENFLFHSLASFNVTEFPEDVKPISTTLLDEVEKDGVCW